MTVDLDRTLLDVVQPRDQVRDRRLARPGGADQRRELPGRDQHRDVAQRLVGRRRAAILAAAVAKRHVIECDFAANLARVKAERSRSVGDLRPKVDQLEDAPEQRQR